MKKRSSHINACTLLLSDSHALQNLEIKGILLILLYFKVRSRKKFCLFVKRPREFFRELIIGKVYRIFFLKNDHAYSKLTAYTPLMFRRMASD